MSRTRTIKVDALARVEGEGGLSVKVRDGRVEEARLTIFEPPRFFEAFLRGRAANEAVDITARICGICPVAYQTSAARAMEDALGIRVEGPIRDLRRALYCGEWIQSHALHVHLLHAPDFLGYEDAVRMAKDHGPAVRRGLAIKKAGNDLMRVLGGRSIHPINVRIGGFYGAPSRPEIAELVEQLKRARDQAVDAARWVAGFAFPDFETDYTFVAMRHPAEYPIDDGRIASNRGLDIGVREFDDHFAEEHVPHSTALHARLKSGGAYMAGPLARYNLNRERLSPLARELARELGIGGGCRNPFKGILVRSVEIVYAFDEAIRILEGYDPPSPPHVEAPARAGVGHGCTEAPRGLLYHRYRLDGTATIQEARIVPPTSQNQKAIEEDLRRFVQDRLDLPHETLQWQCEQAVRNYDPCISCSTHFLRLEIDRCSS